MAPVRVLVLTAVLPEARALARAFRLREANTPVRVWRGKEMVLALVGIRAAQLRKLEDVAGLENADLVIMAGVAGALSPALAVGDVVAEARGNSAPLPPLGRAFLGRVHSVRSPAASPEEKALLFQQTGCLAVDMETDVAAQFAARRGAAFLAVRGISDSVRDSLDPALLTLVDPQGHPPIGRAMGMILRRPRALLEMLRLQRATAMAMASVAQTITLVIASGWPGGAAERRGGA